MKALAFAAVCGVLLAACTERGPQGWAGYAEADYVYVSSPVGGTLTSLDVKAGDTVAAGRMLFALDAVAERAAREEAQARVEAAIHQAANTDKGRRAPEVAVNQAQLAQARAQEQLAAHDLARKRELLSRGFISRAQVDESEAALAQARARVAELTSVIQVARLPLARPDEGAAAQAQVEAARQALRQAQWREEQKRQPAPAAGQVADTFFRVGEFVNAGQPVVALLPPSNIKARFYVPEADLARLAPGAKVRLRCDGCGEPFDASVTFVSTRPEYTPPVIYSNEQRAKLVFMVEARPAADAAARLRPGLPLQVTASP